MAEWQPFNINDYVRVKLTPEGMAILRDNWNNTRKQAPSLGEWKPPVVDKDGWSEFQMWSLMRDFGEECRMGGKLPFQTNIEFKVKLNGL